MLDARNMVLSLWEDVVLERAPLGRGKRPNGSPLALENERPSRLR
jgi:hypothetical protein